MLINFNYLERDKIVNILGLIIIGLVAYYIGNSLVDSPIKSVVLSVVPILFFFILRDPVFACILVIGIIYFGPLTQLPIAGAAKLVAPAILLLHMSKRIILKKHTPLKNNWYLFLFTLAFFISGAVNNSVFFSYEHQMLIVGIGTYFIVRYLLRNVDDIARFVRWYVYLVSLVLIVAFYMRGRTPRLMVLPGKVTVYATDPNTMAVIIVVTLPLVLFILAIEKKHIFKLILLIFAVFYIILVIWSASRGGLVGLMTGILMWIFYSIKISRKRMILTIALVSILAISIAPSKIVNFTKDRALGEMPGTKEGDINRLRLLKAGVEMIKDYPVLGVGPGNFNYYAGYYEDIPRAAHNTYIHVTAENGFLGGSIFIMTLLYAFLSLKKARNIFRNILEHENELLAISIGMSLAVMATVSLLYSFIYMKTWFILFGLAQASRDASEQKIRKEINKKLIKA